jgi:hypothetical protein
MLRNDTHHQVRLETPLVFASSIAGTRGTPRIVMLGAIFALILSAAYFCVQLLHGLKLLEFPDEMEQFVVAQLLLRGHHLYRDIFVSHGPVPYIVSHIYVNLFSSSDFSLVRISQGLLALLSCVALAFCPAVKSTHARVLVAACYIFVLGTIWIPEGINALAYDTVSGFLLLIAVSQLVVPSLFDIIPTRRAAFLAGSCLTLSCFCAYSNGAPTVLFAIAFYLPLVRGRDRRIARARNAFLVGALATMLAIGAWIVTFADIKGYFVYHFYFNQFVDSKFFQLDESSNNIGFSPTDVLRTLRPSLSPDKLIHSMALVLFVYWVCALGARRTNMSRVARVLRYTAVVCLAIGTVYTDVLGRPAYADSGFVLVNVGLAIIIAAVSGESVSKPSAARMFAYTLLGTLSISTLAFITSQWADPWFGVAKADLPNYVGTMKPAQGGIYDFVRAITKPEGDFLALNYFPNVYLKLNRLPASGNLYYLPWQAEYNRHPQLGYKIDTCADIVSRQPAVIWLFNWRVWNEYSLEEYEPCLLKLIIERYTPLSFASPWHIRNDLLASARAKLPDRIDTSLDLGPGVPRVLRLSAPLTTAQPVKIAMSTNHLSGQVALRRIGILLGTFGRQLPGEAQLQLFRPDGASWSRKIALPEIQDNKYNFFDIQEGHYTRGEFVADDGGGIGAWESHFDKTFTCAIYEYVDGSRRYTPACPIM